MVRDHDAAEVQTKRSDQGLGGENGRANWADNLAERVFAPLLPLQALLYGVWLYTILTGVYYTADRLLGKFVRNCSTTDDSCGKSLSSPLEIGWPKVWDADIMTCSYSSWTTLQHTIATFSHQWALYFVAASAILKQWPLLIPRPQPHRITKPETTSIHPRIDGLDK